MLAVAACNPTQRHRTETIPAAEVEVLVRGLDTPWAIDFAPDGRIFFTERPGRIRVVERGILQTEPWAVLDVAAETEAGLMGLALDPQFDQNHLLYVAYTYRAPNRRLQNRLVRLREDPKTRKGTTDKILLDNISGANYHDGGRKNLLDHGRRAKHVPLPGSIFIEWQDSSAQYGWLDPCGQSAP
jgi:glucose/arabinose dehydrogenase